VQQQQPLYKRKHKKSRLNNFVKKSEGKMVEEIQKFTKLTFIIHFIIGIAFTALFWVPGITLPLLGITLTVDTQFLSLSVGAIFAGLTIGSLLGIFAKEWKEVRIVVITGIVYLLALPVIAIISFMVFDPMMGVSMIVMTIIIWVLYLLAFLQQEDKLKPLLK